MPREAPAWSVRQGTPEDSPALQRLFTDVFGVERPETHHHWKFDDNPAGPQVLAVAEHEGRIVGQYALWPMRLTVGRETVLAAQSLDTMTHPDYRGQGMFTRLAKEAMGYAAERGVEVLYGFPNAASYPGFVRKLDWDHTGDVARYVRVLRPSAYDRVPGWAGPVADAAARAIPTGPAGAVGSSRPTDDELVSLLGQGVTDDWTTYVCRDAAYLRWRFDPLSGLDYRWVTARDASGTLTAVAVWGTELRSGRAVLSELLATSPDAAATVLAETVRQARDAGRSELVAFGQRPGLGALLRRAGFIRRGGLPLIVRKLTGRVIPGNVHLHEGWAIFGADLDTF
jgi:GNAT superfamily N-acetyltransferase